VLASLAALAWLLLRSGTKPSRLAYPCQQAALATVASELGAPLVAVAVAVHARVCGLLGTTAAKVAGAVVATLGVALLATAAIDTRQAVQTLPPPTGYHPDVYLVEGARGNEPAAHPTRFGGIDDLVTLMGQNGLKLHRSATSTTTSGPDGMIAVDDVVLLKVNAQWPQRGGTNTDVLRGVIRRIVEHPDGFVGEIIVADNGQGWGSLDHAESNAENHGQSVQTVVDEFAAEGWKVATMLWDGIQTTAVSEYSDGDLDDGYIVADTADAETGIRVSYPKFRSPAGSYVSYKYGIWAPSTHSYDANRLVVINMPVLKTHQIYGITASVKNHMGVVTNALGTNAHDSVGMGGMGTFLAEVRRPNLSILDAIWILARPGDGPSASYDAATRCDRLIAGTDPIALDVWAAKFVLVPQILANGFSSYPDQDPDDPTGIFRQYLDRSMNQLLAAGIPATNDYTAVALHVFGGATTTTLPYPTTTTGAPPTSTSTTTLMSPTTTLAGTTTTSTTVAAPTTTSTTVSAPTTSTTLSAPTTTAPPHTTTTTSTTLADTPCGNPMDTAPLAGAGHDTITASDAMAALRAAVGIQQCSVCVCDVDASGTVTATDALLILRFAVGQPVSLQCPSCS